jgi:type 1 glutamine amidotransferase
MSRLLTLVVFSLALSCSSDPDDSGADADTNTATEDTGGPNDSGTPNNTGVADMGPNNVASDAGGDAQSTGPDASEDTGRDTSPNILLFSRTEGFRHGSISDAIPAIESRAQALGWTTTASEDPSLFTAEGLADFDAIVFVMTTGDILDGSQQSAMEQFVGSGGGWAGIHSASDTEYDWSWYGGLVGAYFDNHPSIQEAELTVEVSDHPSTAHLPTTWTRRDEWYNFRDNPRADVTVLMTIDESTYNGGSMGDDHPMAWCHDYSGGRAWYTAGGHTNDSYADDDFMEHVMGGIAYAAGDGACE